MASQGIPRESESYTVFLLLWVSLSPHGVSYNLDLYGDGLSIHCSRKWGSPSGSIPTTRSSICNKLPLNFGVSPLSLLSMYASSTCSTSHFLPQKAKRFDSVSFRGIPTTMPGCRNSVAFEFRVIPLEDVCFCYLFYITLLPQTDETL
ncbi:hypothetical protein NC653_004911 [Populus alba x Populus x berolinensis]|uniref:Uncharacterized protein n=1 Tax=Populus alba x Populus x berolinensis TaxID=444605 RepID=A0AAD6WCE7_9ROSI|nr:hypothetical protein NC653_004911 [Populus alba x Populus x berolinensis]